jgi:hypothetical protein
MPKDQARPVLPPPLDGLLAHWTRCLADGAPPRRDENFSPAALRRWLGHLALIERHGKAGFRFRLAGTSLRARFDEELTGKSFDQVARETLGDLADRVHRAMMLAAPVTASVRSRDGRGEHCDLILPLTGQTGSIDLAILASYPVGDGSAPA